MSQSYAPQTQPGGRSHVTLTFNRALTDADVEDLKLTTNALNALRVPQAVKAAYDREQELGSSSHQNQKSVDYCQSLLHWCPRAGGCLSSAQELGSDWPGSCMDWARVMTWRW